VNSRAQRTIWSAIVAPCILATPAAHACSPIKSIGVYFPPNSTVVPAYQVLRLAEWMTDLREKYPNHEAIFISGSGEPGEHQPAKLGLKRARNVARILQDNIQFTGKIDLPNKGYVVAPASESEKRWAKSEGVYGVQLDFLPACPHECPCQMGDPLYKPQPQR
jgi:hypothetical protein